VFRRIAHVVAAIMLAALLFSAAEPAQATPTRRVVVLLAPYLTWSDITGGSMPNMVALAKRSLLADMNVRAGAITGASTPDRGAIVLSAGAPVNFASGAISAYSASETIGIAKASDLYHQYFGLSYGTSGVFYLGQPRQVQANVDTELNNQIGALGTAVHAAGGQTAAIGCGDPGFTVDSASASRPAGEAAADENGLVDLGDVSNAMLVKDSSAPGGVKANIPAILSTYQSVLSDGVADLIVVDPGDMSRANEVASSATTAAAAAARATALRATDKVLAGLVAGLSSNDAIVVLSQAAVSVPDLPAGYGPLLIAGPSGAGLGVAASTHRDGIVTEMDVSAAIVNLMGADLAPTMIGSNVTRASMLSSATTTQRVAYLSQLETTSVAVESIRLSTVNVFIVLAVVVLLGSALILYRGVDGLPPWLPIAARAAVLLLMCVQLAAVLQFLVWRWPPSGLAVLGTLAGTTAVCFAVAWFLGRGRRAVLPLLLITGCTTAVLLVDQWTGGTLSFAQVFGYSPLLGARYYGMGNEMAGLLLGSIMMTIALLLDTWPKAPWATHVRRWGWPLIGAVTLITAAAPFWGANVGPVAWMTVGFLVGWMLLNGRRVWTWRNVLIVVVIVIVVVAGLSVIDLAGGAASETHLGRAVSGVSTSGIGSLWTIILRKAETNIRVLGRTNWTWLLVVVLVLLGYMRWRPRGEFAEMLKENPAYSAALAACLFAGVAAYFTEDSGIIIPALMFVPVGVTALYLMLSRPQMLPDRHEDGDAA
jgi:hypothetical protein